MDGDIDSNFMDDSVDIIDYGFDDDVVMLRDYCFIVMIEIDEFEMYGFV